MRSERNAILRHKPEIPVKEVELKGVYILLQQIQDEIIRLNYRISPLFDILKEKGVIPDSDESES